ncbi:MAG: SRPBCC family protein [Gammaproteobacteria bacterium]
MNVVRKLFFGLIVLILLMGVVGVFLPSTAQVERSTTIAAPVDVVYAVVSDFDHFNRWSPWYTLDPDAEHIITGTAGTVGSRYEWRSEKPEIGSGSQTITALERPHSVVMRLDFDGETPAESFFKLKASGTSTEVIWGFETDLGSNPYMHYMSLLMDVFLGPAYEDGISRLKTYVETEVSS